MINTICVAGAGTMGRGIALAASMAGYKVILFDSYTPALESARGHIEKDLSHMAAKGKITADESASSLSRIFFTGNMAECHADLVIEAIIESEEAKLMLFRSLAEHNSGDCLFASNTSSLSIDALQQKIPNPSRLAGLHFFNPAHVMKLVEVVRGSQTDEEVIEALLEVCRRMNKTAVVCRDAPGFIVNRVARHYYLESMRSLEKNIASMEEIDKIMEATGFKMGPFRLMDLIGMDINLAVSRSIYEAFDRKERFEPSAIQIEKVNKGELGRKTGKGFYSY
jgi:3-hydroxybutyryl-CoA dehydrogenase